MKKNVLLVLSLVVVSAVTLVVMAYVASRNSTAPTNSAAAGSCCNVGDPSACQGGNSPFRCDCVAVDPGQNGGCGAVWSCNTLDTSCGSGSTGTTTGGGCIPFAVISVGNCGGRCAGNQRETTVCDAGGHPIDQCPTDTTCSAPTTTTTTTTSSPSGSTTGGTTSASCIPDKTEGQSCNPACGNNACDGASGALLCVTCNNKTNKSGQSVCALNQTGISYQNTCGGLIVTSSTASVTSSVTSSAPVVADDPLLCNTSASGNNSHCSRDGDSINLGGYSCTCTKNKSSGACGCFVSGAPIGGICFADRECANGGVCDLTARAYGGSCVVKPPPVAVAAAAGIACGIGFCPTDGTYACVNGFCKNAADDKLKFPFPDVKAVITAVTNAVTALSVESDVGGGVPAGYEMIGSCGWYSATNKFLDLKKTDTGVVKRKVVPGVCCTATNTPEEQIGPAPKPCPSRTFENTESDACNQTAYSNVKLDGGKCSVLNVGCGPSSICQILHNAGIEVDPGQLAQSYGDKIACTDKQAGIRGGSSVEANIDALESYGADVTVVSNGGINKGIPLNQEQLTAITAQVGAGKQAMILVKVVESNGVVVYHYATIVDVDSKGNPVVFDPFFDKNGKQKLPGVGESKFIVSDMLAQGNISSYDIYTGVVVDIGSQNEVDKAAVKQLTTLLTIPNPSLLENKI